jgi:hypothetical protein
MREAREYLRQVCVCVCVCMCVCVRGEGVPGSWVGGKEEERGTEREAERRSGNGVEVVVWWSDELEGKACPRLLNG